MHSHPPQYPLFPYTTLFRSRVVLFKKVTLLEDHALRNDLTPDGPIGVVGASAAGLFSALLFARAGRQVRVFERAERLRSEEHTSELQSRRELVCRLLLEINN